MQGACDSLNTPVFWTATSEDTLQGYCHHLGVRLSQVPPMGILAAHAWRH